MPDVPDTLQNPIPETLNIVNLQDYIREITTKTIPKRNQLDENTEQIILFHLLKLRSFRDEFASIETLYACIELVINLIGDKIIQLSKIMPEQRNTRVSSNGKPSKSSVIKSWIDFFIALQRLLHDEKRKIEPLLIKHSK